MNSTAKAESARVGMTQGEYIHELEAWRQRTAAHDEVVAALLAVKAWVDMGGLEGPHANPDAYPDTQVRAALAKVQL